MDMDPRVNTHQLGDLDKSSLTVICLSVEWCYHLLLKAVVWTGLSKRMHRKCLAHCQPCSVQ